MGVSIAGWCPSGRLAEDGVLAAPYSLRETPQADVSQRTRWNVRDSDGTLIIRVRVESPGTSLTEQTALELGRPLYILDPRAGDLSIVRKWISDNDIDILNVAGPRESEEPGIYRRARTLLMHLLKDVSRK